MFCIHIEECIRTKFFTVYSGLVGVTYVVDGEDDRASSAPGTCHDTDQLECVVKKIHGCRNFGKTLIVLWVSLG